MIDVNALNQILKGPLDTGDKKKAFKELFAKLNNCKTQEVEAILGKIDLDLLENLFKMLKQERLIFKEDLEPVIKKVLEGKYTLEVLENELFRVLDWPEKQHEIIDKMKQKYVRLDDNKRNEFKNIINQKSADFQKKFMKLHDKQSEAAWHVYRQLFYELDHCPAIGGRKVG
jgi:hypothetical protein